MRDICPATLPGALVDAENEICQRYCGERMEAALGSHNSEYDVFYPLDEPPDGCEDHHASYSDALTVQTGNNTTDRILQTVDMCDQCGNDYGNDSYTFRCALVEITSEEVDADERQLTLF